VLAVGLTNRDILVEEYPELVEDVSLRAIFDAWSEFLQLDKHVPHLRHYPHVKPAVFHPKARDAIREFPEDVRREFGKVIFDLQKGEKLSMPLSRPMASIASGVEELRVRDRSGAYRVFYYTKLADSVLIFHAFAKKTQKTPPHEMALAQKRLKEMLDEES